MITKHGPEMSLSTPLTRSLGMKHPIISAGMYKAGGPELVAAVSNAGGFRRCAAIFFNAEHETGGLGVIGGLYFTPDELRSTIQEVKVQQP